MNHLCSSMSYHLENTHSEISPIEVKAGTITTTWLLARLFTMPPSFEYATSAVFE